MSIRGQSSKGEHQTLHGELVAVREELSGPTTGAGRFSIVPADSLLDLPPHPEPPPRWPCSTRLPPPTSSKSPSRWNSASRCQEERRHFVDICRDYLTRSFEARIRAAQDRVMALRMREASPARSGHRPPAGRERTDRHRADPQANGSPGWTGSPWSSTVRSATSPRQWYYRPVRWVLTLHASSG